MSDYLLQESGFRIALEDGTGFLLLESSVAGGFPWSATLTDAATFGASVSDAGRYGATSTDAATYRWSVLDAPRYGATSTDAPTGGATVTDE